MTIKVDTTKCCTYTGACDSECGCGCSCSTKKDKPCVESCPTGALTSKGGVKIDEALCDECGVCIDACCKEALFLN